MSNDNLPEPNFNSRNSSTAYQKLDESLSHRPDAEKLNQDITLGTLDDHVDITDPEYNETKTKQIEVELATKDGIEPLPEDPVLKNEAISSTLENPSDTNPL